MVVVQTADTSTRTSRWFKCSSTIQNPDTRTREALWFRTEVLSFFSPRFFYNGKVANAEQAIFGSIWSRAFRKYVVQRCHPLCVVKKTSAEQRSIARTAPPLLLLCEGRLSLRTLSALRSFLHQRGECPCPVVVGSLEFG